MVFSSNVFLYIFLPLFLGFYYAAVALRLSMPWRNAVLLLISLVFYVFGNAYDAWILVASIVVNWTIARGLRQTRPVLSRVVLIVGVSFDLALLAAYKYACFLLSLAGPLNGLASRIPGGCKDRVLPVGISFFTFMAVAYLMDVYRQRVAPASFIDFGAYLSLFPHLVAGPIVRYSELAAELRSRKISIDTTLMGLQRFSIGLFKKVFIANQLSPTADYIFSLPIDSLSTPGAWIGLLSYTFQIYFDFSGYTDMAIGLAKMLGFTFPENFNQPYRAASVTDFWRRWHMTLSRWFRDYLYIPLGGSRCSPTRTYVNLAIVFVLCGLWHGAAWTFVVWGAYHGLLLVCERLLKQHAGTQPAGAGGRLYTFAAVMIGWVFFRSDSLDHAWSFLQTLVGLNGGWALASLDVARSTIALLALAGAVCWLPRARAVGLVARQFSERTQTAFMHGTAFVLSLISVLWLAGQSYSPFIYFRF